MDDLRIHIDPKTGNLAGPDRHHQFIDTEVVRPPRVECPGCGDVVELVFCETDSLGEIRSFILTRWECAAGCEAGTY